MFKRINKVRYIIEKGDITKTPADILFVWTTPMLKQGDAKWKQIHKEAGSTLYDDCLAALIQYGQKTPMGEDYIPVTRSVITRGGKLDVYNIIHCVVPNKRIKEEYEQRDMFLIQTIHNALFLANEYSKIGIPMYKLVFYPIPENICGSISFKVIEEFWKTLLKLTRFKEIRLVCTSDLEYNIYSEIFQKLTTTWVERLINRIFGNKF